VPCVVTYRRVKQGTSSGALILPTAHLKRPSYPYDRTSSCPQHYSVQKGDQGRRQPPYLLGLCPAWSSPTPFPSVPIFPWVSHTGASVGTAGFLASQMFLLCHGSLSRLLQFRPQRLW
jgi:hypothetical protein